MDTAGSIWAIDRQYASGLLPHVLADLKQCTPGTDKYKYLAALVNRCVEILLD